MQTKQANGYAGFNAEEIAAIRYAARKNLDRRLAKKSRKLCIGNLNASGRF